MNDRIVDVGWLAERLDAPNVVVIDVRDAWEYEGIGHVPGAVSVPFDAFRADEHGAAEAGMLPGADAFTAIAEDAGVDPDDEIVAYDDTHGVFAARFLVTAELYGHDPARLHLLDGDYSVWNRSQPTTTDEPDVTSSTYPAAFRADGPLIDREAMAAAVDDPDATIVDTREAWEYEEGHVPGAVRLDWRELVDTDARTVRPETELRELLASRGIDPDDRVVLYCNTARRISHTYTVLRALDYPDIAFYEGSLAEWKREGGRLETGDLEPGENDP
ncbi:sulfurtransferase [Halorubrum cibi]|uniref:Thiosulfate/3-mercaptopyruvate sulfurtransferase n=1 Tax=Halorubrum cibi TaxID=413815 RepID=A0A521BUG1_9EURY|nr:rhodanese-like domain-containing protein [Halorubrum cibi]SMO50321.1 thiosulfate/3-mercaptopyruvate sulfurtransferase [Halorubrum cibi]